MLKTHLACLDVPNVSATAIQVKKRMEIEKQYYCQDCALLPYGVNYC